MSVKKDKGNWTPKVVVDSHKLRHENAFNIGLKAVKSKS